MVNTIASTTPNTVTSVAGKAIRADPSAMVHHACFVIYVEGTGFQMHRIDKQSAPADPSVLICNVPFTRAMNPVFLAALEHWSPDAIALAPKIRETGFYGEATFIQSEYGLAMTGSPWWPGMTEAD